MISLMHDVRAHYMRRAFARPQARHEPQRKLFLLQCAKGVTAAQSRALKMVLSSSP
jgi:hypothetical protein